MDWDFGAYRYFSVLTYDAKALKGPAPKNWEDFWTVENFPGKRTLLNNIVGMLEAAPLASGVIRNKIYPIDVDRALAKIKEIKPHTIF